MEKYQDLLLLATILSDYYPFEAMQLQSTLHLLMKAGDANLEATSNNKEAYIRLLSMHEVGIEMCDKGLTRIVSTLALKHGLGTRLKLWMYMRKKRRYMPKNSEFLRTFSKDTIDAIRDRAQ